MYRKYLSIAFSRVICYSKLLSKAQLRISNSLRDRVVGVSDVFLAVHGIIFLNKSILLLLHYAHFTRLRPELGIRSGLWCWVANALSPRLSRVTRQTEYGERYKLFVIPKNSFNENYDLEKLGISLASKGKKIYIDNLKWNGLAKKIGLSIDDQITEFKVENLNRPNKAIVYPFALLFLLIIGYTNFKSGKQFPK